ncbi:MAG: hypothetical protein MSH08_02765 [Ezakiella sp.]|nr:hypothetical protein [Ezakiella sp.]MDD7472394.1 hypothetical protein [Bacillota bacterium]MDY3923128.1 hypothetical protein [Ezakiella sp.]
MNTDIDIKNTLRLNVWAFMSIVLFYIRTSNLILKYGVKSIKLVAEIILILNVLAIFFNCRIIFYAIKYKKYKLIPEMLLYIVANCLHIFLFLVAVLFS